MSETRRTKTQISDDYKKIKKAAETSKSWREIEEQTGLTYSKIKCTLGHHPVVKRKVCEMLSKNAGVLAEDTESEIQPKEKRTNKSTKKKVTDTDDIFCEQNIATYIKSKLEMTVFDELKPKKMYVIDTSISNFDRIDELFFRILYLNSKIIITSIVNDELEKVSKIDDADGYRARMILRWSVAMPEIFKAVYVQRNQADIADNDIIKFCQENEKNIVLVTADKHMAIDARIKGVKVICLLDLSFFQTELKNAEKKVNSEKGVILQRDSVNEQLEEASLDDTFEEVDFYEEIEDIEIGEEISLTQDFKEEGTVAEILGDSGVNKIKVDFNKSAKDLPKYNLDVAYYKNGVLLIKDEAFKSSSQLISVKYFDKLYWKGPLRLTEGMGVFVVKKINNELIFEYYVVTTISFKENCARIFSYTISPEMEFEDEMCNEIMIKAKHKLKL